MLALTCMVCFGAGPSFNDEILPILSNNCFACHGPDAAARQSDLRLDLPRSALAAGVIVPHEASASQLMERVRAQDPSHRMPPADTGKTLTGDQIDTLRRWIDHGAHYEQHWSFLPPQQGTPPSGDQWCRTPVDAFVKERLDEAGLAPNVDADRRTLIRRLSLDLTGLPPAPDDIESFVQDESLDAYERLVDRLLSTPQFGEHAARPWLDLARYADSQGFEKDNLRTMWRWRDWVIEAFNSDMPFDQFTQEQLAGDLLPDPSLEQRIATGFHRNTQTNTEGGTDNEEFRCAAVIDRVNTTMQGWMGLTAGCAQCHDHKYDPLSQQAYFELFAFFNQTADADLDNDAPFLPAPTAEQAKRIDQLDARRELFEAKLDTPDEELRLQVEAWAATRCLPEDWATHHPLAVGATGGTIYVVDAEAVVIPTGLNPSTERTTVHLRTSLPNITGVLITALSNDGRLGRDANPNFVLNDIKLSTSETSGPVGFVNAEATFSQSGFDVTQAIDEQDTANSGWAISPAFDRDHTAVFTLGQPVTVGEDGLAKVHLSQQYNKHGLGRFKIALTNHALPELEQQGPMSWDELVRRAVAAAPALEGLREESHGIEQERAAVETSVPTALIMEALPHDKRRTTKLFLGGSFLSPDEDRGPLQPTTPDFLHPMERDVSRAATRLDLAAWLTDDDNPLTARVQVNRVWEQLFGRGLVSSVDDFGVQGARPSHPELLDWLALHWQHDLGWSHKQLVKLLVMSSVYRQSAHVDAVALEQDPRNRLLSRAPRLRLSAEQLRDSALASAGLLKTDRIGGPSVTPRLREGVLPQAFTSFVQPESTGDDLYRRGLYTQWRRTGHYPTFATFDAPSRELCLIARERSNTPLQALAMLNDEVFVEAAQGLARRALRHGGDPIGVAFELALARAPTEAKRSILEKIHAGVQSQQKIDERLATEPLGPLPEGMDPREAAAMTVTCNVILNLDEFVNRP